MRKEDNLKKKRENPKKKVVEKKVEPINYDLKLIQKIAAMIEAGNIEEFLDLRRRPWKLIWWNFVIGLFRGIGFLLGASVVGAVILTLGTHFVKDILNSLGGLPWIGEKIAHALIYINKIIKESQLK